MIKTTNEIEINKIKKILCTINKARQHIHSEDKKIALEANKLLNLQQTATRLWRETELKIRIASSPTIALMQEETKWKNITKIFNCPTYMQDMLHSLSSQERIDIITTIEPFCKKFLTQLKHQQTQQKKNTELLILTSTSKKYHILQNVLQPSYTQQRFSHLEH